jgi:hypothetical protein
MSARGGGGDDGCGGGGHLCNVFEHAPLAAQMPHLHSIMMEAPSMIEKQLLLNLQYCSAGWQQQPQRQARAMHSDLQQTHQHNARRQLLGACHDM